MFFHPRNLIRSLSLFGALSLASVGCSSPGPPPPEWAARLRPAARPVSPAEV